MKKLLYPIAFALTAFLILYSCSVEEEDTAPPPQVQQPTPEPEPEVTQFTLAVTAGEGGTVSTEGGTYDEGTEVTVTATPDEGYEFIGWEGSDSTEASLTFNLSEDGNYFANFREIVSLGTISLSPNPVEVKSTYAILEIDIQSNGGGNILSYGICWSENYEPSIDDFKISDSQYEFGINDFKIKGLEGGKSYYLKAFLENESGITYSNVVEISSPLNLSVDQCKLTNYTLQRGVGLGFPINQWRTASLGDLNISLIFVDFDDAESNKSTQEIFQILSPVSENFFNKSSYGKFNIKFSPIHKWYRMSKNSESYIFQNGSEHRDYLQEAIDLADNENDFNDSDAIIVITNPDATNIVNGPAFNGDSYWSLTADDKVFYSSANSGADLTYWGGKWLNHEFFHNLGLPDLYEYGAESGLGFTGQFSMMGLISGFSPDIFGFSKWNLNWIEDYQVVCGDSGEFSAFLKPIEDNSVGKKIIIYALSDSEAIVVESRRKIELDVELPNEGPLVYVVDTKILTGEGPIKVLPYNYLDQSKSNCILEIGEELIYENVLIRYILSDHNGDLIEMIQID